MSNEQRGASLLEVLITGRTRLIDNDTDLCE